MIKQIIFLLGGVLVLQSCTYVKKSNQNTDSQVKKLEVRFPVSAQTKFFLRDIEIEWSEQKVSLKKYTPSQRLIEKYGLVTIKELVYVHGMAVVNDEFTEKSFNEFEITTGALIGKTITLQIPIKNIDTFFLIKGIDYFQISEKVNIK